jgi:hypothetical protein
MTQRFRGIEINKGRERGNEGGRAGENGEGKSRARRESEQD